MLPQPATFLLDSLPPSALRNLRHNEDYVSDKAFFSEISSPEADSFAGHSFNHVKFFTEHIHNTGTLKEKFDGRTMTPNFYPIVIISVAFMLVISAKALYWRAFRQFYESLFSMIKFRLWMRDTGSLLSKLLIFTTPAYLIIFSLAADFLIQIYLSSVYEFSFFRYLSFIALISLIYGLRHLLMRLSAVVFTSSVAVDEQIRNIQIHNTLLVFFLIFLLPPSIYFPGSFFGKAIIPLAIIIECVRIIKGLISAKNLKQYSIYYFFLYFCTVEILPVLIIVKTSMALEINKL
jgi:hypothetical protein